MTGKALIEALRPALAERMPGCDVREALLGRASRRPETPAVVLAVLEETRKPGFAVPDVKLGATLYAAPGAETADLFPELCAALEAVGAPVVRVTREKPQYDSALGCTVSPCVARTGAETGSEGETETVEVSGKTVEVSGVKVTLDEKRREYGEVGESAPHTVRFARSYTMRLTGVRDAGAFRFGETYEVEFGGMRYADCTLKEMGGGSVVLAAGHAARAEEESDGGI